MKEATQSKSFRLPLTEVKWLESFSSKSGNSQTDIITRALAVARQSEGKEMAIQPIKVAIKKMENGGNTTRNSSDNEAVEVLTALGITTASAFAGYHISGWVMEQFEMDEDKGAQVLFGMVAGLTGLLMSVAKKK